MKNNFFLWSPLTIRFLPLIFLIIFTGCEKEAVSDVDDFQLNLEVQAKERTSKVNTYYGPAEQLAHGVVRSMVTMTHDGIPVEIGIRISEKALLDMPDEEQVLTLRLPNQMKG